MKVIFRFGTRLVITVVIIFSVANTLFDLYTVVFYRTSAGDIVDNPGNFGNFESYHKGQGGDVNAEVVQENDGKWEEKRVGQAQGDAEELLLSLTESVIVQPTLELPKRDQGNDNNIDSDNSGDSDKLNYLNPSVLVPKSSAKFDFETSKSVQNVVAPVVNVDHELKLKLYQEYWKLNSTLSSKTSAESTGSTPDLDRDGEKELLRRVYNRTLWGLDVKEGQYGLSVDYDNRVLLQKMWQLRAAQIQPEIFRENKTKVIRLKDTFKWWNYKGGELLSCAGPFNHRCQMVDSFFQGPVDAVIAVQDAFHNKSPLVGSDVFRIFFALESPFATPRINLVRPKDLLASYWRGSDIYTPYSTWLYYDPNVRRKPQTKNYAAGKTEMAAIFVSNCYSQNDRLEYVKQLQEFMDVHIYGECGDRVCTRKEQDSCFAKLKKNYRFYLAFENSNCRDYITEKFFINAFQNDLIPVVMGAHPDDYKAIAPENSFIHVEDYGDPAELAIYLKGLAENEEAYNKYFEWKGTGEFISTDFFCRVCSLLYYSETHPPDGSRRSDFHWQIHSDAEQPMCLQTKRRYWTRINS